MSDEATARLYTLKQKQDMLEAFPLVDPGLKPFGSKVTVQIRTPKARTAGGIVLPDEARETEKWNTQVGLVMAMGPVAFKNRDTLQPWPEQAWCKVGDFVRVPKYGGDGWEVPTQDGKSKALFKNFNDLDLGGLITVNPLDVVAYFD